MTYEWDEEKNRANKAKHGIGFEAMVRFEWDTALLDIDERAYDELREVADGLIGPALFHVVFTRRNHVIRVISLRKTTKKERLNYAKNF